jgi:hypothetical protein
MTHPHPSSRILEPGVLRWVRERARDAEAIFGARRVIRPCAKMVRRRVDLIILFFRCHASVIFGQ